MPSPTITSAPQLWQSLVVRRGLEPDGRDAGLVDELRRTLGLDPGLSFEDALSARKISVEQLLVTLLDALATYGRMWSALLRMLVQDGGDDADEKVQIRFDFDAHSSISVDLAHFRRARRLLAETIAKARRRTWDLRSWQLLWELAYRELDRDEIPDAARDWVSGWEDDRWPDDRPLLAATGDGELDGLLADALAGWQSLVDELAALAPSPQALQDSKREAKRASSGLPEWVPLADLDHDRISETTLCGLIQAAERAAAGQGPGHDRAWRTELRVLIDSLPAQPVPSVELVSLLDQLLELPVWKKRYELYSVWLLALIREEFDGLGARITLHDGVLIIGSKPACQLRAGRLSVWSELQTELNDPWGKGRTGGVRPDWCICVDDPGGSAGAVRLVIEAKQYKRPSTSNFTLALADYARAFTAARVLLAAHGPATDALLDRAPKPARTYLVDERGRIGVVGGTAPGGRGERLLRDALQGLMAAYPRGRVLLSVSVPDHHSGLELLLRMPQGRTIIFNVVPTGSGAPHVTLEGKDPLEATVSADEAQPETGASPSPAPRVAEPGLPMPAEVWLTARRDLRGVRATVAFFDGAVQPVAFERPERGSGRCWHVADIGADGAVRAGRGLLWEVDDRSAEALTPSPVVVTWPLRQE